MSYKEKAREIQRLMGEGQLMKAFEKYYHEEVVMEEASGEVRKGKATNREFQQQWLAGLQQVHGSGVNAITSDEEAAITMVEYWVEVEFKDGNRMKLEEVAVQRWQDGQIVHERFYYNAPS